jgi:hypothetical protein
VFGILLPAFAAVDRVLAAFLGPLPRLIVWGCLMGALVMALYRLISPQRKLAAIKSDAAATRRQMAGFDGEFDQLTPLIRRSLRLSLQQITWILLPAIVASLPLIACLMWLYSAYSFTVPSAGKGIALTVSPAGETISAEPVDSLARAGAVWELTWPPAGETLALRDRNGTELAHLGGQPGSKIMEPFRWWNWFIGNPAGYVPAGSPVQRLEFELAEAEVLSLGPAWLRGWETPFFLALIAVSILLKVVFRIE